MCKNYGVEWEECSSGIVYYCIIRPGVQSRVTAEKKDYFKNRHKLKDNFSAFSERFPEHPVEML
jgi:hypothetical protein